MKKNNHWGILKNFIYLVLIIAFLAMGSMILENYLEQVKTTFHFSPAYVTMICIVFFGGIGVLLGLSSKKRQTGGTIQIDKSRLLLLTLPSLFISLSYVWLYLGLFRFLPSIAPYIAANHYIVIVSCIVMGHSLITSFRKKPIQ
ncbi:hypothetical protein [Paenibacillus sp.]|jgi:ABC-type Fe3+ transport system permease subunit|uniref:hypothetical protein n=1 Tax=Paenibacillus sp. TaxID=58172 RepID=UPI00281939E9|nr:hypothetical protein [Paenibacillus sp.]MDR0269477.1 hypothetical protein [Paenibacillus sp.]